MAQDQSQTKTESGSAVWLLLVYVVFGAIHLVPAISGYLELRWMDVGLGGALVISLMLLGGRQASPDLSRDPVLTLNWILLLVYFLHQFEEHGVDLFGRDYHFMTYANTILSGSGLELTINSIYRINTLVVWLPFLIGVWGGRRFTWPGVAAAGLVLVNGISHILMAVSRGEYNPGLATSVLVFLPVAYLYFSTMWREQVITNKEVIGGIVFGLVGHAMLPLIIWGTGPNSGIDGVMFVALVLFASMPLIANVVFKGGER